MKRKHYYKPDTGKVDTFIERLFAQQINVDRQIEWSTKRQSKKKTKKTKAKKKKYLLKEDEDEEFIFNRIIILSSIKEQANTHTYISHKTLI